MLTKSKVIEQVEQFSNEFSLDDLTGKNWKGASTVKKMKLFRNQNLMKKLKKGITSIMLQKTFRESN